MCELSACSTTQCVGQEEWLRKIADEMIGKDYRVTSSELGAVKTMAVAGGVLG